MATTYTAKRLAAEPEKIDRRWIYFKAPAELAVATTVDLADIPANKRVVGGLLSIGAGGAAATGTLGDGTTADLFGSLTDMTLATVQVFGNTPATGLGNVSSAARTLVLTTAAQAIQINTTIHGYVDCEP